MSFHDDADVWPCCCLLCKISLGVINGKLILCIYWGVLSRFRLSSLHREIVDSVRMDYYDMCARYDVSTLEPNVPKWAIVITICPASVHPSTRLWTTSPASPHDQLQANFTEIDLFANSVAIATNRKNFKIVLS